MITPRKRKEKDAIKTNTLYVIAIECADANLQDKDLIPIDRTQDFYEEITKVPKNNEHLNININGPVAKGKSTVGMAIVNHIQQTVFGRPMNENDICMDQEDLNRKMLNPDMKNTIVLVDEWNEAGATGINATTERAVYDTMSAVQAQRYVHRVSCSPTKTPDEQSDIFLEVIQADKQQKITRCLLFYKVFRAGIGYKQLIGHVDIDVSEVLTKKWYQEYRRRKFAKMELMNQHGIFRTRELGYAKVMLDTIEQLKEAVSVGALQREVIKNVLMANCRAQKIPLSIIGVSELTERVYGIICSYREICKMDIQEYKELLMMRNGKTTNEHYEKTSQAIQKRKKIIKDTITAQLTELHSLIEIDKQYKQEEQKQTKKIRKKENEVEENGID